MVIVSKDKYIHYLSPCYLGTAHDYSLLKSEFPPENNWFENHTIRLDLGYKGFETDYLCQKVVIPHKKPRKSELTQLQKDENTKKSKKRICVEHAIGGLKRYRFLSDRLRNHDYNLYNDAIEVCAGLWNFNIKN
ncbi:transposase family protein [Emticicia sp.]|uniref:transposase family protein n=1 Tax=Emticicia sp. TaxID=1930953 RepID=UPI0037525394